MSDSTPVAGDTSSQKLESPWHAAYPVPKHANPPSIPRTELLQWFRDGQKPGVDFLIVDLRRMDHEGGTIHGSINLPAQSLYPAIPTLYAVLAAAKIARIVWYCGSSRGRGNRAAGWFGDYIEDQGDKVMKSFALEAGINGWAHAGEDYVKLMDGYQEAAWKK
ncbi:MAG: hypothetical protein M1824_000230 [Vezdaea acicularis]|nr:MAG: hypothetical protein M1824_000230 [Vezdaea acicularis]